MTDSVNTNPDYTPAMSEAIPLGPVSYTHLRAHET